MAPALAAIASMASVALVAPRGAPKGRIALIQSIASLKFVPMVPADRVVPEAVVTEMIVSPLTIAQAILV